MNDVLPPGWVESTVGECFLEARNGTTATQNTEGKGLPVSRIETVQNNMFDLDRTRHLEGLSSEAIENFRYRNGDIAFSHINSYEHVGKTALYTGNPKTFIHGMNLLRLRLGHKQIEPRFAHLFMQTRFFREEVRRRVGHAVNQVSINQKNLAEVPFVIAPLAEQQRIVAKLERLLGQVDTCQKRLARIPSLLKRFRQSVLAAACSGSLTETWRDTYPDATADSLVEILRYWKDNQPRPHSRIKQKRPIDIESIHENLPDAPASWRWITFGEMLLSLRSGSTEVPQTDPTEYPILRSSSVRPGFADLEDVRFLSAKQSQRLENFLSENDLLFTRLSGSLEYVANCALVRNLGARQIQYPDRLFCGRLKEPRCAQYVETAFANPFLRDFLEVESKSSAGHQRISMGALTNFPVPLPPLDEQREIVRRVEGLFKLADRLEARFAEAQKRVDSITQSVLGKAFRGELVPTEFELAKAEGRSFESAEELLERIRNTGQPLPEKSPRKPSSESLLIDN